MRVRIVCYEGGSWIVAKFADHLRDELRRLEVDADVAREPEASADINHHLVYIDLRRKASRRDTVMVTHVDDVASLRLLRQQLEDGATGICVSSDTLARLVRMGLSADRLCHILPAHDENLRPRPLVVGITTRIYPEDGRKRESLLLELASRIRPEEFRFFIMGDGWEKIVGRMREMSFTIDYFPDFDSVVYRERVLSLDYFLYLSNDEGSMGFVDACAAGVPTIVTAQGFHLDAPAGLTHSFSSLDELTAVFEEIATPRRSRAASVAAWTWPNYARKHLDVWNFLLTGQRPHEQRFTDGIASLGTADPRRARTGRLAFAMELFQGSLKHSILNLATWRRQKLKSLKSRLEGKGRPR